MQLSDTRFGIILLAAGASTRLKQPKQLLPVNGATLLHSLIQAASESGAHSIVVVTGAYAQKVGEIAKSFKVVLAENKDWKEGMASSIRCGINTLESADGSCEAFIIMTCDQPHVDAAILIALVNHYRNSGALIVTSNYGDTIGPPAIFDRRLIPELLELQGDAGARKVVESHALQAESILFPAGAVDIDTIDDFKDWHQKSS